MPLPLRFPPLHECRRAAYGAAHRESRIPNHESQIAQRGASARPRVRWTLLACALLALYGGMAWTASLGKGVSFDEGVQLAVGYNIWLRGDFRIEGANGDLIKRWATVPYLFTRPQFLAADDPLLRQPDSYELGRRFLFAAGNRPEALLWQARAAALCLALATGALVFLAARALFGPLGALVSLALFAFSPNMLAFGGLVSTDMSIAFALFGSTLCIWRLLHEITWGRVVASLLCFGCLVLAKMTAALIVPIAALLLLGRFLRNLPLTLRWRTKTRVIRSRRVQAAAFLFLAALHFGSGLAAIWAHYNFRYSASPSLLAAADAARRTTFRDGEGGPFAGLVHWAKVNRVLPEGYCNGIEWLLNDDNKLPGFLKGEAKLGGWRSFFPYAIWVKSRPTLLLLLPLAALAWWQARRHSARQASLGYRLLPHLALAGVYIAAAMAMDLNIGHRHVLPIYPALYVMAGAVVLIQGRWKVASRVATLAALAWGAAESVAARPDYLAYFGPQAGGMESGSEHLVDSSLDWGTELPALRSWLDEANPGGPVFLAYFGTDDPDYHGIRARRLPGFFDRRTEVTYALEPGCYVISATLFRGVYLAAYGRWNALYEKLYRKKLEYVNLWEKAGRDPRGRAELLALKPASFWRDQYRSYDHLRFARLCAWLRQQGPPPHHIGHSLFVWRLSFEDLHAALLGPPPEQGTPPPEWERLLAGKW